MTYASFVISFIAAAAIMTVLAVLLCGAPRRRYALRIGLGAWLGVVLAVVPWELYAYYGSPRALQDNPWYDWESVATTDLPHLRPPHRHWQGKSRGDLAMLNDDEDPYARPVEFGTDHQGFRNARDLDRADIVFLGDSFTEAGNVNECESFAALVGERTGLTVRNLGLAGYGPPAECILLERYALPCEPKVIVWQIAEVNDLNDARDFAAWVAAGRPRLDRQARAPITPLGAWQRRSPTYRLYRAIAGHHEWPLTGTFRDMSGVRREVRFFWMPSKEQSPIDHPGWPVITSALQAGTALARSHGIRLIVLLVPMKLRVLGKYVAMSTSMRATLGSTWDFLPAKTLAHALSALCRDLEIEFVDATPRLRAISSSGVLTYLPFDTHLSPEGHVIVAELLTEMLARPAPR